MQDDLSEEAFLSIGEVLDLLKAQFPDVTISKIRFLESQGLLDPDRTPSGYRKFYEEDVERLRWILREQRENFLPLKVIKGKLESQGQDSFRRAPAPDPPPPPPEVEPPPPGGQEWPDPPVEQSGEPGEPMGPLAPDPDEASFTFEELARASRLSPTELAELERFGLLSADIVGGQRYYDADGLTIARAAAAFAIHGVQARHLRMYKTAAEREATFYEQVVIPLLKQRKPAARRQAIETLTDLAHLGAELRGAILRHSLRPHLEDGG
ncbi:MAG: transcriptional regulator FtsR [Acidimicrobiales bacterium]